MNYYLKFLPYCQVFFFGVMGWNRTTINGFADHRLTTRPPSQTFLADHRGIEPLLLDLESNVLPLTLMACGRDDRARTCDLMLPKHVRYQLRYIPIEYCNGQFPQLVKLENHP